MLLIFPLFIILALYNPKTRVLLLMLLLLSALLVDDETQ
jgi:hypothetical protein